MKIEREKLFALVWEKPLYKLAPEFEISDRGLAKLCIRNNVPLPPRGFFWEPLEQNGRFNAAVQRSACFPFHELILNAIAAGETIPAIRAKMRARGFGGSASAVREYVAKVTRGQGRVTRGKNQYREFELRCKPRVKPYEVQRPPLPPGPEFVFIKERVPIVAEIPPDNEIRLLGGTSPRVEPNGETLTPSEPQKGEPVSLLTSLGAELEYARKRDVSLYLAFWLSIGTDLPEHAYTRLDWCNVRDASDGWLVQGPLTKAGHEFTCQVAPRAAQALRPYRRAEGPVLRKPHWDRKRIALLLGQQWRRHVLALRAELGSAV